ncbi:MAG: AMP-binding protein, partial [Pyrinomonadaceae bacterium]|nr:AMP-binding protein [Pyrinomonadaceae bacterium]
MTQSPSETSSAHTTLPKLCLDSIKKHAKRDALNHKSGKEWINISGEEFIRRVRHIALGLAELGIKAGDRVALLSENRPDWSITDLAILSLGAVNVPIYTTQAVEQVAFILQDSGARALFVSGRKVFRHASAAIENLTQLEKLIFFDKEAAAGVERAMTLEELEASGAARDRSDPNAYDALLNAGRSDDLATIIYTSGTTGEPKGVMLTHNNFIS